MHTPTSRVHHRHYPTFTEACLRTHLPGGVPPDPLFTTWELCTFRGVETTILCVAKVWTNIAFHRSPQGCEPPGHYRERIALPVRPEIFTW